MPRHDYAGGAVPTTITAGIGATDLTIQVTSAVGWPSGTNGKFYAAVDRGLSTEEKILIDTRSGTTLTIASTADRGVDGTAAQSHNSGATIEHVGTAHDLDEADAHINDTSRDDHTQYLRIADAAGDGLGITGRILSVTTDATTLETNADALRVKDAGISAAKLAANAVTTSKILDNNVTTAKIPDSAITTAKILDANVTTSKILDANVTAAKLATDVYTSVNAVVLTHQKNASDPFAISASSSGTAQTVPFKTTHTITVTRAGQVFSVNGVFNISYIGATDRKELVIDLYVDGTIHTETEGGEVFQQQAIGRGDIANVEFRVPVSQQWVLTGLSVGTHTLTVKAWKNGGDFAAYTYNGHTNLMSMRFG